MIARSGSGAREMFTVRRIVAGEGVERKFPLHSPRISQVEVKRSSMVRRGEAVLSARSCRQGRPLGGTPHLMNGPWTRIWAWLRRRPPSTLGERGEAVAARYLRRKGYTIVARQAREGFGELDLVAVDRGVVVFVEVKTRRSDSAGHPAEAVDLNKQRRLTRAALAFCGAIICWTTRCGSMSWPFGGPPMHPAP